MSQENSRSRIPKAWFAGAAAFAFLFVVAQPGLAVSDPIDGDPCSASLSPASVQADEGSVTLEATLSEDPGAVQDVGVESASGLEVDGWQQGDAASVEIHVATDGAEPGTWSVAIVGDLAECSGDLTVEESDGLRR